MSGLADEYAAGRLATVMRLARAHLRRHPDNGAAKLYLGMALRDSSRYEEAEALLLPLLEDKHLGRQDSVRLQLALLEERRGNPIAAVAYLQQCIDFNPEDAGPRVLLGAVHARAGNLAAAEQAQREAVLCSEGPVDEAWLNLALVLRALERSEEAEFCVRKALELDQDEPLAQELLADLRASVHRDDPA